jgi:hypothetical protein
MFVKRHLLLKWCVFKAAVATRLRMTLTLWLPCSVMKPIRKPQVNDICLIVSNHQWTKIEAAAELNQQSVSVSSVTSYDGKATVL